MPSRFWCDMCIPSCTNFSLSLVLGSLYIDLEKLYPWKCLGTNPVLADDAGHLLHTDTGVVVRNTCMLA